MKLDELNWDNYFEVPIEDVDLSGLDEFQDRDSSRKLFIYDQVLFNTEEPSGLHDLTTAALVDEFLESITKSVGPYFMAGNKDIDVFTIGHCNKLFKKSPDGVILPRYGYLPNGDFDPPIIFETAYRNEKLGLLLGEAKALLNEFTGVNYFVGLKFWKNQANVCRLMVFQRRKKSLKVYGRAKKRRLVDAMELTPCRRPKKYVKETNELQLKDLDGYDLNIKDLSDDLDLILILDAKIERGLEKDIEIFLETESLIGDFPLVQSGVERIKIVITSQLQRFFFQSLDLQASNDEEENEEKERKAKRTEEI